MWLYKIKAEKSEHGFYRIPKTCVNAEYGRFEKLLEYDDSRLVKSAVVNWFNEKHNFNDFYVGLNGINSIILYDNKNKEHDLCFQNFNVINEGYLIYHENQEEYEHMKFLVSRHQKIDKLLNKIKI